MADIGVAKRKVTDMNDEILSTLKEILKWTRIQATPAVKALLEATLSKREYRKLYQALDGELTQQSLVALSGLSQPRISSLIADWQRIGLVEEPRPKRYKRLFDLDEFGIAVDGE